MPDSVRRGEIEIGGLTREGLLDALTDAGILVDDDAKDFFMHKDTKISKKSTKMSIRFLTPEDILPEELEVPLPEELPSWAQESQRRDPLRAGVATSELYSEAHARYGLRPAPAEVAAYLALDFAKHPGNFRGAHGRFKGEQDAPLKHLVIATEPVEVWKGIRVLPVLVQLKDGSFGLTVENGGKNFVWNADEQFVFGG